MTFRMRQILQLLPGGVVLLDRTGRIVDLNAAAAELLTVSMNELRGEDLGHLLLGARRSDGRLFLTEELPGRRSLLSGVPQTNVAMELRRSDREPVWIEMDAIPLGSIEDDGPVVLVSFRDVTQNRLADDAIRFQAGLLDAAAEAIIATDRQLRITYCNAGTETLLQRTRTQTIGESVSAFIATDRRGDIDRIEHLLSAGLVIRDFETVVRRADGSELDVSLSITSQTDEQGHLTGSAIAIIHDISQRVRAARIADAHVEQAARAARQIAEETTERVAAQRASEAKTEMLSRISHALRTPLNAVLGFAQLLEGADLADPLDRRSVAEIQLAGGRLLELVDEVLDHTQSLDRLAADPRPLTLDLDLDLDELANTGRDQIRVESGPPTRVPAEPELTILVIDPDPSNLRAVQALVASRGRTRLVSTTDGRRGVEMARELRPDLLLLSDALADLDSSSVLAELRGEPTIASTCLIVMRSPSLVEGCDRSDAPNRPAFELLGPGQILTLLDGLAMQPFDRSAA